MKKRAISASTKALEHALVDAQRATYSLKLFVTGMTPLSERAIVNVKRLCTEHLAGRYQLEVIDLYQHPQQAEDERIVATPTLIKKSPQPERRVVGDLSDSQQVLMGLGLKTKR